VRGSARCATPARPQQRHDALAAGVRRLVEEACNYGDLAALGEVLAPFNPTDPDGRAGAPLRDYLAAFRAAVPDARWTIVEQVVLSTKTTAQYPDDVADAQRSTHWTPGRASCYHG
jgi:hypothetical protein